MPCEKEDMMPFMLRKWIGKDGLIQINFGLPLVASTTHRYPISVALIIILSIPSSRDKGTKLQQDRLCRSHVLAEEHLHKQRPRRFRLVGHELGEDADVAGGVQLLDAWAKQLPAEQVHPGGLGFVVAEHCALLPLLLAQTPLHLSRRGHRQGQVVKRGTDGSQDGQKVAAPE